MSTETPQTMKAIQVHTFGGPEVFVYEDVPRPTAGPDEVLIRVHAVGVNPADWYIRSGYMSLPERFTSSTKPPLPPLPLIVGSDVSGIIEAVGPNVTAFHRGDAVYGLIRFPPSGDVSARAYAEYVTAPVTDLAPKPASLNHLQAAAVPMAALTVFQAILKYEHLEAGQTVLVNGAAGGLGHFAVQLVKARGTRVIGVASVRHEAFLRELGADEVIDYTTTPLEKVGRIADLVIDTVTGGHDHSLLEVLKRGGTLLTFGLSYSVEREASVGVTIQRTQVHSSGAHLAKISDLIDAGQVRVAIDTVVPLAEASKAHERGERGHLRGKIVLRAAQ